MAKSGLVRKTSVNGKAFFSRVVRHGPIQKWFKENIGDKAGKCVQTNLLGKHGHSKATQVLILKACTPEKGKMTVPSTLRRPVKAMNPAVAPADTKTKLASY